MRYTVQILKRAQRDLEAIPSRERTRIADRIDALADNPRPPGSKPLKGEYKGLHRIRVGDYRVIYQIQDRNLVVIVTRVVDRKDAY